jgi:hypothetical protein
MTLVEQITKHLNIVDPIRGYRPDSHVVKFRELTLKIAKSVDEGKYGLDDLKPILAKANGDAAEGNTKAQLLSEALGFVVAWLNEEVEKQGQEEPQETEKDEDLPEAVHSLANEICDEIEQQIPYTSIQTGKLFRLFAIEQRLTGTYAFSSRFQSAIDRWKVPCHDLIAVEGLAEIRSLL